MVKKGNPWVGQYLLRQSGIFKEIFGRDGGVNQKDGWSNIRTMGEFFYLLTKNTLQSPSEFYKNKLKGDIPTVKEILALEQFCLTTSKILVIPIPVISPV